MLCRTYCKPEFWNKPGCGQQRTVHHMKNCWLLVETKSLILLTMDYQVAMGPPCGFGVISRGGAAGLEGDGELVSKFKESDPWKDWEVKINLRFLLPTSSI